jgi:uncharacterized membrane protein YozB (DUF420 family)
MTDKITSFADLLQFKNVFVLYLIVACNFLANTFGCRTQKMLNNNMYVKHLVGFMTIFFFITLLSLPNVKDDHIFFKKLGASLILYIVFMMSTRTKGAFFNIFLVLICLSFIINAYIDTLDEKRFKLKIEKMKKYASWCEKTALVVLVIGVIVYFIEKKQEYKDSFNFTNFIVGNVKCRDN